MIRRFLFLSFLFFYASADLWAMGRRPQKSEKAAEVPPSAPLSLTLEECYELAVRRSETLAIRKEEVSRTLANFLTASGEAIGDADVVMTQSRQDPQKASSSGDGSTSSSLAFERRQRRFVLTQPLFQGFRTLGAISAAGNLKTQRKK